jgi:hypothetical protein
MAADKQVPPVSAHAHEQYQTRCNRYGGGPDPRAIGGVGASVRAGPRAIGGVGASDEQRVDSVDARVRVGPRAIGGVGARVRARARAIGGGVSDEQRVDREHYVPGAVL